MRTAPPNQDEPLSANATPQGPQRADPKQKAAKATRLPVDFTVPPEWLAWAAQARPGLDVALEAEKFCDYWKAASGRNATKHDWAATWRNWIRNAHPTRPQRTGGPPRTGESLSEHNARSLRAWLDKSTSPNGFPFDLAQLPPALQAWAQGTAKPVWPEESADAAH